MPGPSFRSVRSAGPESRLFWSPGSAAPTRNDIEPSGRVTINDSWYHTSLESFVEDGRQSAVAREVCRGVRRLLRSRHLASVTELVLADGRRADVVALGADGAISIIEIKSSVADFRADTKWPFYRKHCDRLYFAIPTALSPALMPADAGLIVADAYGADIIREAPEHRLAGPTRRALLIRFAQAAADRLHLAGDPGCRL